MFLAHPSDTEHLGARLAAALRAHAGPASPIAAVVHLVGQLGAGKTTLVRGLAGALGIEGPIKSPTYTLVEPYTRDDVTLYHFDLYRLGDGEELEYLGARDAFAEAALCVIEWPERGQGWLPEPDLLVQLTVSGTGREAEVRAGTPRGAAVLENFADRPDS
jgi:tRNA threonylcarbamoyladenosine biosynthesis protein TsaE